MKRLFFFVLVVTMVSLLGCARMGSPDGGWYDERPPEVIRTVPEIWATNVDEKKINIFFNEYISVDNPTENIVISPPQLEMADIKDKGKSIQVILNDTLKENTTYTIDFSSAIKDYTEGNLMGNYTFSFATGEEIDTLQVGGYVLEAETLDPIEGILVGLYMVTDSLMEDTAIVSQFHNEAMLRVAKTDESGHFSIKGVKEGCYHVYALKDVDNNFLLTPQSGEQVAFLDETIVPTVIDDTRQDTTMLDSLRIKSIDVVAYKHYLPDRLVLRAFTEENTTRAFLKSERNDPEKFTLYYTYGDSLLPEVRGLNFDLTDKYVLEASEHLDTITYWLRDTMLVNTDSLEIEMTYRMTDTLGVLVPQTDTLMLMPRQLYAKRLKDAQKAYDDWFKKEQKKKKKGLEYDSIMPPEPLQVTSSVKNTLNPDQNITLSFPTPIARIDSSMVHVYIKRDTVWYNARWLLEQKPEVNIRTYELRAEWQPGFEYSVEIDSTAIEDIYGKLTENVKIGLRVKALEEYGTLRIDMPSLSGQRVVAQLLDQSGKIVKEAVTSDGVARFWYLDEKDYYLKAFVDRNGNGRWDSGEFDLLLQPEELYYYPKEISCRAKWDIVETWNPTAKPLNEQKPSKLRARTSSSKNNKSKTNRNQRRAEDLGIELPEELKN